MKIFRCLWRGYRRLCEYHGVRETKLEHAEKLAIEHYWMYKRVEAKLNKCGHW